MEETKSKRSNIMFKPSVYEDLRILASLTDTSVNDILHELAKLYISNNEVKINAFKEKQAIIDEIQNDFIKMTDDRRLSLSKRLSEIESLLKGDC